MRQDALRVRGGDYVVYIGGPVVLKARPPQGPPPKAMIAKAAVASIAKAAAPGGEPAAKKRRLNISADPFARSHA